MRKSILACTVSLLMSPVTTWALGMGDVQVNSSLNQPLHAEIDIHSASKKDIESLRINIASKDTFSRAGLERSHYLTKFKFTIKQKNGKSIVSITTSKPFKEPYIEFLIEASWSSGRLIREYTILVDPPEFINTQSLAVKSAEVNSSSQVRRDNTASMEGLSYGPTQYNDTLWTIAKNLSPNDVSINQMMLALLRENPQAFINNNINNLKAGYVLRINDQKNLYKLDKRTAQREVSQQYQTWKDLRQQQTSNTNLVDRSERNDTVQNDGELKLLASGKSDDTDKINKDSNVDEQAKEIREKLALSIEAIDSATSENLELRERVKELEAILETKSSLMELKDASLAALQKQLEVKNIEAVEDLQTEEDINTAVDTSIDETVNETIISEFAGHIDASVELAKDEQLALAAVDTVTDESIVNDVVADEIIATDQAIEIEQQESTISPVTDKIVESEPKEAKTVEADEIIQEKPKAPVEKTAAVKAKTAEKPVTPIYEEIPALLIGEYLPFTAGGLGLLVILLLVLKSRSSKKEQDFEESILDEHTVKVDSESFQEQSQSVQNNEDDNETSFLSDFSTENTESLMPDDTEADPLSEADVFMVYGRYLQAEEFLKEVIEKEPQRVDFQMKLLEVYLGDNQKDAFVSQAELIKGLIIDQGENIDVSPDWATIIAWAKKFDINLSPEDSIEDSAVVEESETDSLDNVVVDNGEASLDDTIETIEEEPVDLKEPSLDDNLVSDDADLDLSDELSLDIEELDVDELDIEEFDIEIEDDIALESEELDHESAQIEVDDSLELDDFELEEVVESKSKSDESIQEVSDDLSDMDLDDDLSLDIDSLELDIDEKLELDNSDLEESDLSLDLDDDFDLDMSDLDLDGDLDEANAVDTKLDLARAYIDMEDIDSASSILTEVLNEGDEEQKSQAKALQEQADSK